MIKNLGVFFVQGLNIVIRDAMNKLVAYIKDFAKQQLVVLGDVILDEYIAGTAERMSREAPIPVLEWVEKRVYAGGAANPSANMVMLGATVTQVGVIGNDPTGEQLKQVLQSKNIDVSGLVVCDDRPTTLKTRILAQMGLRFPQQVARIDTLNRAPISEDTQKKIIANVQSQFASAKAILFSDYSNGLMVAEMVTSLRDLARQHPVLLTADAQGHLDRYHGFDLVKCNAQDAQTYLGLKLKTHKDYEEAAESMCRLLELKGAMVITRGADGATLATADGVVSYCAAPKISDVFDTVGAGDTAIAVMTLARLAGATWQECVMLSNYASGIVVQHTGNYTPTAQELMTAIADFAPADASDGVQNSPSPVASNHV